MSFSTRTLAYMLDSLVRVSRRDSKNHFGKITIVPQASYILHGRSLFWCRRLHFARRSGLSFVWFFCVLSARQSVSTASFSTISDLFTLFSKSFSSIHHSTCSLSVSHPYLALEDSYLPLRAAVPSNSTLCGTTLSEKKLYGTFTLYGSRFNMVELI